ncbi:MAG: dTDP-4-dehydrorhamnose reductase [Alphaproteobacteria bacterium]
MKIVITGAAGQLGQALQTTAGSGRTLIAVTREDLDIADRSQVESFMEDLKPDVVINAAAYTAVDKAESERDLAFAINGAAVGHLASAAARQGARFVHVSTDFVFDGASCRPYRPADETRPLSVYGASKRAGEEACLAVDDKALIVRTAWVYAAQGKNFVRTMLRLMGEKDSLRIVADQIGAPTASQSLAQALWGLLDAEATGLFHHTDSGVASWYDFAVAIQEEACSLGLLDRAIPVEPIPAADYPTPAARPGFSVLDTGATKAALGRAAPHWRVNLRTVMKEIATHG